MTGWQCPVDALCYWRQQERKISEQNKATSDEPPRNREGSRWSRIIITRFFADGKIAEEWVEFDALEFSPPSSALFYKCPHRK